MTVREIAEKLGLRAISEWARTDWIARQRAAISAICSAGVMARAESGDVWLTVMGNVNAIAVASLTDAACIVLTESAALDEDARARADQQGIAVLTTELDSYGLACRIAELL